MPRKPSDVFDVAAEVSDLRGFFFCVKAAATGDTMTGYFVDMHGDAVAPTSVPFTFAVTADTVFNFLQVYNTAYSQSPALTALPADIVGVRFDHGQALSYFSMMGASAPSAANCRLGPTWDAAHNRCVGRNG